MARTTSVRRVEGTHPTLSLLNRGARREGKLQDAEVVSLNHNASCRWPRGNATGTIRGATPPTSLPRPPSWARRTQSLRPSPRTHPLQGFPFAGLVPSVSPSSLAPPSGSRLALLNVTVVHPFAWPPWSLMQMKYKDNVPLHFWNPSPVALVSLCWTLSCIPPSTPP